MKALKTILTFTLTLCHGYLLAEVDHNPLWSNFQLPSISGLNTHPLEISAESMDATESPQFLMMSGMGIIESADAEIVALANALDNEPLKIFNYVRNHVRYEHYYGIRKGAILTLLEGSGNDMDQCMLLAKLLEAADSANESISLNIEYHRGRHRMSVSGGDGINVLNYLGLALDPHPGKSFEQAYGTRPANWQTLTDLQAKQLMHAQQFLELRVSQGIHPWPGDFTSMAFHRVWLKVTDNGATYELDPSFKVQEEVNGIDLLSATNYSRSTLLSTAGGTTGEGYVKNLNDQNVRSYLDTVSSSVLAVLNNNYFGAILSDIVNGRRVIKREASSLSDAYEIKTVFGDRTSETNITNSLNNYKTKIRFKIGSMEEEFYTSDLNGRKITLTFAGDTVELRLDDAPPVATATVTGATFNMNTTIIHPGLAHRSMNPTYKKHNDYAYAILYGFSPSGRLLHKRYEQLNAYLESGTPDDSREVRTELLNIMGLTWLYQCQLSDQILASQNNVIYLPYHRIGRMAQEGGFYVDVPLMDFGSAMRDGVMDDGRFDNVFQLGTLFASGMEHGIIEQMQPGTSAVSTVNIIRQAVIRLEDGGEGGEVYLADLSNWSTVKGQLQSGEYPASKLTEFDNIYDNLKSQYAPDTKLFLPKSYKIRPKLPGDIDGNWEGSGWVIRSRAKYVAGMVISGDYNGGYSYWSGSGSNFVSSPAIYASSYSSPTYSFGSSSTPMVGMVPRMPTVPKQFGSDPVDMATGAFVFSHVDLSTGVGAAPRGLSFSRDYSSALAGRDGQHLGYGWSHPLHIRASRRTGIEEALGLGTIQQAAAFLTASLVGADLYRDDASPKEWGVAVLTVAWFVDQMLNNAVAVTMGNNTFQFIEHPDGTFEAPPSSNMKLEAVSENFRLSQPHGNTMFFEPTEDSEDTSQRVQKIVDPYGKEMSFVYLSDDRLDYVQDAYGRKYTFTYADDHISRVTDSTDGRFVEFRYDAEWNLDRVTDPEGKYFYYDYEVAGDPGGTVASEHRIVKLRNHSEQDITQNVYDELGRVTEQFLHGSASKTWKLRFTGGANTEEDPEGGVTTYFYDERGRSSGKRDADGNETLWSYDGQDRIIERVSPLGEVTSYEYDNRHNLIRIDHPEGYGSTINVYDSLDRLDLVTDPNGNQTDYVYFTEGNFADKYRPHQIIDPAGTTTFAYMGSGPAEGNVWRITDDNSLVTENAYDATYGQPLWTKAPGNFITHYEYTSRGDLDYVIDPNTVKTSFTYNKRRQLLTTVFDVGGADEASKERVYNDEGHLAEVIAPPDNDAQKKKIRFSYTPTEKLHYQYLINESAVETDDLVVEHLYDGRDWVERTKDAFNRETELVYYGNGSLERVNRPLSRTEMFIYDEDGRLTSQANPGSPVDRIVGYEYLLSDASTGDATTDFPKRVFNDADSNSVTIEEDRQGNTRYFTNKLNHTFEFRYDGLGRQTHVITPLDAVADRAHVTQYNHRGEVTSITEPSGQTATYSYDPSTGRIQSAAYNDGTVTQTVDYTLYDANGNLKALSEGSNTIQRTYDNLNRVKSYTDANGNMIGYRYYDSGNIAKIIYPGGSETEVGHVEYTYWKTGRLKQVIDKLDSVSTPRITAFHWHNDGRLHRVVRPNGTERRISYDGAGRPELVEEFTSEGQLIALHKNKYFPSDELEWVYQLPHLQTASFTSAQVSEMTYNADNQVATFEGQTVSHDADGNMTYGPLPNASFAAHVYDSRNRLQSAGGLAYAYDPEGERMALNGNGDSISYVAENSLGLSKVIQRTKNGQTTRYIWGVGMLYEVNGSGDATYYHYDNVGSTIALSNQSAEVIERLEYAPFGTQTFRERTANHSGALHDTPFLWTGFFGNQTDSNGLLYLRNRYYNTLTRSFINSDPAREGWNWFAYAGGNPIAFVDPTGLGLSSALDAVQTGLSFLGLVPVVGNAFDVVNASISLGRGDYVDAGMNLLSAIPGVGQAVAGAKIAGAGVGVVAITGRAARNAPGTGYHSFSAFKRAEGAAGPGQAWHHIVEQTPGNIQRFGTQAIHNTDNLVRLPHGPGTIHNQISGFYSSKQPFTGGQTVRQWLSNQPFDQQATFGRNILQQFGGAP